MAGTSAPHGPRYKWIALSNTTIGVLMVTINSSIVLIALPDIFRGIHLDPLAAGNTPYFLWMLMGFMVATAVLVVTFGRIGDMYGRVRMYNLGFAVFTAFSILLSVTWLHGAAGALYMVVMRVLQGVGGALLFANSSAILTDAFPENQRGLALGINTVAAIAGSFIGLILGGLLGPVSWRLVFLISVPVGLFGTVWAYLKLRDTGVRLPSRIDWWGNVTFAVGLVAVLVGITYGVLPYGHHLMGWTNPRVLGALLGGLAVLVVFAWIETRVDQPMFRLRLFRIRPFTAGNIASLLSSLARGGMMFILIIWLQGIWLPLHGYSFASTPLWAGIYMVPMTVGFLVAGPIAGSLSDRFGARPFATGGMVAAAVMFALLQTLPADFQYVWFALLLFGYGLASGLFSSPNQAGIMNSLPPSQRGAGSGMAATFQNSSMVLSIGIFFTLIIVGLSSSLPHSLDRGLVAQGVPVADAARISHLPAVSSLFAAFLGYNPMAILLRPVLPHLSQAHQHLLTGRTFFPHLIAPPFMSGLRTALDFALAACLLAAVASWLRGRRFVYGEGEAEPAPAIGGGHAVAAAGPPEGNGLPGVEREVRAPVRAGAGAKAAVTRAGDRGRAGPAPVGPAPDGRVAGRGGPAGPAPGGGTAGTRATGSRATEGEPPW
ncbi:MAG TPA: MFS transporter [Acidimicrobiales bacterium]|nr:MFS transporter [Acidimicrobiales bacterium]